MYPTVFFVMDTLEMCKFFAKSSDWIVLLFQFRFDIVHDL